MNISDTSITSTLNHQLWQPVIAPGSFAHVRASAKVALGDFVHVPMIACWYQTERGTSFSTSLFGLGLSGSAEVTAFEQFVRAPKIDEPKITQDTLGEIGGRLVCMFLAPRRRFTAATAKLRPVSTYFFTDFMHGNSPKLCVYHASELRLLIGPAPAPGLELEFVNTMLGFTSIIFINDLSPGRV